MFYHLVGFICWSIIVASVGCRLQPACPLLYERNEFRYVFYVYCFTTMNVLYPATPREVSMRLCAGVFPPYTQEKGIAFFVLCHMGLQQCSFNVAI